jgi:hypothetical protein
MGVSEEHIVSNFRVEELAELISSTLKMEAICSSERSVDTQRATQRYIPEDDILKIKLFETITGLSYGSDISTVTQDSSKSFTPTLRSEDNGGES